MVVCIGCWGISAARTHKALDYRLDQKDSSGQHRAPPLQQQKPAVKAASWWGASQDPASSHLRDLHLLAIWKNPVWVIIYVGSGEEWFRHSWADQVSQWKGVTESHLCEQEKPVNWCGEAWLGNKVSSGGRGDSEHNSRLSLKALQLHWPIPGNKS